MQLLQYNLTHPYPRSKLFTTITLVLVTLVLPVLVIVNIATVGQELVPSLRGDFQQNDTVPLWWETTPLSPLFRRKPPPCQPKDLGKGDTFRLSPSLFEYKVLSSWRTNRTKLKSEDEGRIEYRGGSFGACFVYDIRFDLSFIESTQSLTVGISCPDYPVRAFLETRVVFATEHSKDVIGQFYGYDVHLIDFVDEDSRDYRRVVFDVLDVISTDSLSILDGAITQWLSLSARASVSNELNFISTDMVGIGGNTSANGENKMGEAEIYRDTISNLMRAVQHAVELDLGNPSSENIFTNSSAVNSTFSPNLPPKGIAPRDWVGRNSFRYDRVEEPYFTFAQMLRAGVPANITTALGNLTGLPGNSTMVTNYLCPSYQPRPISSLLVNVFIGTATMFLSAWTAWMSVTAMLAKRIAGPCVTCTCGTHLDPEGQPTRCDHSHAIVVSGLTTGLVSPPSKMPSQASTESVLTEEKGEPGDQNSSVQEIPKIGAVGTRI
ncbi:hypothetical protein RhiXN_06617 [Rhizoctonia solani]|uniref:Transmembrane protein n=1 Tax=Rhizoctonia solani TaxID=456999 RepID=A0A8H8SYR9_9AGAM|nr:uncharacterized protein RhiXN_06617 [Rhizoctonia solani]QRW21628.1 hypothetical protein RhiXN_06617 [Rhizoctonia solani]